MTALMTKPGERLVYEGKPVAASIGTRASRRIRIPDSQGGWHILLTESIRTLSDFKVFGAGDKYICNECGYAYGNLTAETCSECRVQKMAEAAAVLEKAGIPLGWGGCGKDTGPAHVASAQWRGSM